MKKKLVIIAVIALVVTALAISPFFRDKRTSLKVIYAGSLIVPFEELEKQFESKHPGVDVQIEGHGSIQVVRHLTDLHKEIDVLVVADDSLIPDMVYTAQIPGTSENYADWYVRFAKNQVVIAYTDKSKHANEINESNWYEILGRKNVKFGFSNPMLDACGYRTLMVIQLAESYYDNLTIFDDLIAQNFDPAISLSKIGDTHTMHVPEIFEPKTKIAVRGGSVQLLPLLKHGEIDYAFEYKSVAQQHGLRFLELPPQIDLSSTEYEDLYKKVNVRLGFQRFKSVDVDRVGRPIFYGITIPKNAPHSELAVEFVKFVISKDGQRELLKVWQPPITPTADNPDNMPWEINLVVKDSNSRVFKPPSQQGGKS